MIDFVAPYFDQTGISILIRKKEPTQSIFKFMQVRKPIKPGIQNLSKTFHSDFEQHITYLSRTTPK